MDFFDAAQKRYSHKRKFAPTPVPLAHLEQIAAAGLSAPTGVNSQCVQLIILGRAELSKLDAIAHTNALSTAPAAIALFTDPEPPTGYWYDFSLEDYAAASATMCLASVALGYVSLWLDSPFLIPEQERAAKAALGIPERCRFRIVIPVGHPAEEEIRRPKKPFAQRVSYGHYGQSKPQ